MAQGIEQFPTPPGMRLAEAERLMSLLKKAEAIGAPWSSFARSLLTKGRLRPAWRELVILRVAWRRTCPYAFEGHRVIASSCGLTEGHMTMATRPDAAKALTGVERLLILAADELIDVGRITATTKTDLKRYLDDSSIIELAMLVGQYVLVGMICETFELIPEQQPGMAQT